MGYNAYANGQYSVAMGYNANAIPSDAIAIGDSASATGNGGIAIGMGSTSSGRGSGSIGLSNKISGNSSYVYGNGNNVGANNAFVLGNTVTVAAGNDGAVVLGNASAPGTYVQTTGATIRGTAYAFAGAPAAAAGTNPTVSVGAPGAERQITNVAAGELSATSTNAINGSQLYATNQALNAVTAVAGAGWNLSANGGAASNVAPGATVDVSGGASGNISVTQNGSNLVIDTNPSLTATSLTTGNTVVNNAGVTVNGGPNGAVSLTNTGLNNGGNTITNVGAGALSATSTDAVNGSQLYTTNQNVTTNATNISNLTNNINNGTIGLVQQVGGAPGNGTITVGAATGGTLIDVSGTSGSRVITGVGNGAINSTSTDAVNGSQLYAVSQAINAGWDVASGATGNGVVTNTGAPANVAPGKSATFVAGNNLAIAQNGTTVAVAMQNDISLNSVTATTVNATTVNSTTVNADKISINNGPTISSGGIDAGGTRITNVSAGINQTDVVNVSQMTQGLTDILNKANNYTDSKFSQVEFDLRSVDRNARAGTASAMAIGMLPQAFEAGRGILSGAVTTNMGEQGFALGLSKASDNGRYIVKAAVSYNTRNQVAGGVAGGIQF